VTFATVAGLLLAVNAYLAWSVELSYQAMLLSLMHVYAACVVLAVAGTIILVVLSTYLSSNAMHKHIKRSNASLKLSETIAQNKRYTQVSEEEKSVLDGIDSGVIIMDPATGAVRIINERAAALIGHKYGRELFYFIADPEFNAVLQRRENTRVYREADERVYLFSFMFDSVIAGQDCILVYITDVTRIKNAEYIKDEFISSISHELSTPLTLIAGYAELIRQGMDEENIKQATETIILQSKHLSGFIKSILKFTRVDADDDLPFFEVDVSKVIIETLSGFTLTAKEKGIDIISDIAPSVLIASRNEHVAETVNSLVSNALRFNRNGGTASITLKSNPASLTVEDTGLGISEENLSRIFDRFFKAAPIDSEADYGGYGLGLALVKKVALKNNWTIKVDSEKNKGTKIVVIF